MIVGALGVRRCGWFICVGNGGQQPLKANGIFAALASSCHANCPHIHASALVLCSSVSPTPPGVIMMPAMLEAPFSAT
jgi:hypothetical protein